MVCRSLPQIEHRTTRTRISEFSGVLLGAVRISQGELGPWNKAAWDTSVDSSLMKLSLGLWGCGGWKTEKLGRIGRNEKTAESLRPLSGCMD
jgi:hypothetical protein